MAHISDKAVTNLVINNNSKLQGAIVKHHSKVQDEPERFSFEAESLRRRVFLDRSLFSSFIIQKDQFHLSIPMKLTNLTYSLL